VGVVRPFLTRRRLRDTVLVPHLVERRARASKHEHLIGPSRDARLDPHGSRRARSRGAQNREAQLAQACGISNHIDFSDLAPRDHQTQDEEQPSRRSHDDC